METLRYPIKLGKGSWRRGRRGQRSKVVKDLHTRRVKWQINRMVGGDLQGVVAKWESSARKTTGMLILVKRESYSSDFGARVIK